MVVYQVVKQGCEKMAVPETTTSKNAGGATRFLRETKVELKKVTWPTKQELIAYTAIVLVAVLICAALIWVIDSFFNVAFRWILQ